MEDRLQDHHASAVPEALPGDRGLNPRESSLQETDESKCPFYALASVAERFDGLFIEEYSSIFAVIKIRFLEDPIVDTG